MPILLIRFIEKHCSVGRLGLVKNLHFHGPTSDGSEARMVANLENAIPTLVMMVSLLLIAKHLMTNKRLRHLGDMVIFTQLCSSNSNCDCSLRLGNALALWYYGLFFGPRAVTWAWTFEHLRHLDISQPEGRRSKDRCIHWVTIISMLIKLFVSVCPWASRLDGRRHAPSAKQSLNCSVKMPLFDDN